MTTMKIGAAPILASASKLATTAELAMAETEIQKSCMKRTDYQKGIPDKVKEEVGKYATLHGTQAAIKKYSLKHPKYTFRRTTVNSWKSKIKNRNSRDAPVFSKVGRPNLLDEVMLQKVKDIITGTRLAGSVINRKHRYYYKSPFLMSSP